MTTEQDGFAGWGLNRYEMAAWSSGYRLIAGVDEAGRGPLAGPVTAAACILDWRQPIKGLNDSKKLTAARRQALFEKITCQAIAWQVAWTDPFEIDKINILNATRQAMYRAVAGLAPRPELVLIDAVKLDRLDLPALSIVKGDALSCSIAAASILAKVTRDRIMEDYDRLYPVYGFARHKGYPTRFHYEQIIRSGPCPIHRRTFLQNLSEHKKRLSGEAPEPIIKSENE